MATMKIVAFFLAYVKILVYICFIIIKTIEIMTIELTNDESLEFFHGAMCNALGWMRGYGISVDADRKAYNDARAKLTNPCIEDVYKQILLDGNTLNFRDDECDGDYDVDLTLQMVYDRVKNSPIENLINIKNECDDVIDADAILQTVLYGEIIFG